MKKSFIQDILDDILQREMQKNGVETLEVSAVPWLNYQFVFPSKRPAAYLQRSLQQQTKAAFAQPQTLAIADFISKYSLLVPSDTMSLVIELYECYLAVLKTGEPALSLLQFYPLGETLIGDFGDIDKDLVNAEALFANFTQMQNLEDNFAPDSEQMAVFKNFWHLFSAQEPRKMQREFLALWQLMGALYFEFRTRLQSKGIAYAGLAERNMVQQFSNIQHYFHNKIICICGFNALTKAEIKLFKEIETVAEVHYYFDYDKHYMAAHHEAGHFMRRNLRELKDRLNHETNQNLHDTKEIHITSASGTTGMVQALYQDLSQLDPSAYNGQTGIVLPDENALRACIEVLPTLAAPLNITMGMPLQSTSIWSLVKNLFQLQVNYNKSRNGFLYRDVVQVLQQPELALWRNNKSHEAEMQIAAKNIMYCTTQWLVDQQLHEGFMQIFKPTEPAGIFDYLLEILATLELQNPQMAPLQHTALIHTYQQVSRFGDLYMKHLQQLQIHELWLLYRKATQAASISFEAEPVDGLQLMGLLESRMIDFDRLFILSVNEGIIPKSSRHQSLIPYGIRKAFGMNTFREDDAVSAYYFYRLLQRASKINLYYNTDTDGDSKGEPSRYILQIKQEMPQAIITEKNYSIKSPAFALPNLQIIKQPDVMEGLQQYEVIDGQAKRPLSPSALSTYIKSQIQFYLRFVANFRERDNVLEEMDAIALGNIVHNTLEDLYKNHLNQTITYDLIENLILKLPSTLERNLQEEMNISSSQLSGRNLLFYNICSKLCLNVLQTDRKTKNLRLLALEFDQLYYDMPIDTKNGRKVIRLKGQFDRLDEVDGVTRVVDYKTGKVKIPGNTGNFLKNTFERAEHAAVLQTLFYTLVYLKNNPQQSVLPVIYHLKSTENLMVPVVENPLNLNNMQEYEMMLKEKLEEIWNHKKPFIFDDYENEQMYLMMDVL
ncbi:hypothetical protein GC194_01985 [bacterium]|nr:hypothetical protein [bacterium]